ncbi:hypothetical protein HY950_00420, partial [Candidatus Gottesmanbacteria bacterium]|nr:hypothetical protein [Candidatus Gottesmanbacteria bacterium]
SGGCTTAGGAPTPTPASCSCTAWIPQASCGNGCATVQERFYTRTCTPGGCDVESSCFTAAECACDPNAWSSCSVSCGSGTQTNACGDTRSCCIECGPTYGAWGTCSGSPATKSRTVLYDCQANSTQSTSCYGTINSRAVVVSASDTTCSAVNSSSTGVAGTTHAFTPGSASQPSPQTQTGDAGVSFNSIVGGSYTLVQTPPADYVPRRACYTKSLNTPATGEDLSTTLSISTDNDTITWNEGYTLGNPWVQVTGGDVYSGGALKSYVGGSALPKLFNLNGDGGYPGLVSYGTSYDFDSSPFSYGSTLVSSTNWLVNETIDPWGMGKAGVWDPYTVFWRKFGGPITVDYDGTAIALAKPTSRLTPYVVTGDMTTSGDWAIGDGETIVFLVNGNLTLNGKVTITGSGFAAFIVSGNITIDSSVGVPPASSTPVIEGIYVTNGTFNTGTSGSGTERFVGKGMFVANSFNLQRDLGDDNTTTAAELFLYNPQLLLTQPEAMNDLRIFWQEVAP